MGALPRNRNVFNETDCTRCGICFNLCPELHLPLDKAKEEIKNLISRKESKFVLSYCTSCFSCNIYCPNDCKPYQLILERWNDLYKKRGAPSIYRFVCPSIDNNVWQMVSALMIPEELSIIKKWMTQKPKNRVLLVSNYLHLLPFVYGRSKLLNYFTPIDPLDHWECGAYLYQGGYLDIVKQITERCRYDFKKWGVKTVVPSLDAVEWMITNVHPTEMNVNHDIEVINFHSWLLNKIENKELLFSTKLNITVTLHDNCFSKVGNGKYWEPPRTILRYSGCKIIEMKHNRENSLCCGFGAGASWNNPRKIVFDILSVSKKKFREAEATGADALVTYCGGCLYLLWIAKVIFESKIDVFHIIEITRMSMGEKIDYPKRHIRRAWDLITIINYHFLMSLFYKSFWIQKISLDCNTSENKRYIGLKLMRRLFDFPPMRIVYKKVFQIILPKMITSRDF